MIDGRRAERDAPLFGSFFEDCCTAPAWLSGVCISIPVRFLLLFAAADDLLPCICSGRSVEVNSGTTALICSAPAAAS